MASSLIYSVFKTCFSITKSEISITSMTKTHKYENINLHREILRFKILVFGKAIFDVKIMSQISKDSEVFIF